ncbi:MAG TPA: 2Fe-2S iron-sulfur cluster-binding protein [Chitinophagales bacterium]|nr:2Fe-2S iron-sulfur cluster-binding protein [Chitinophagales bacterium]HRK28986.1 2Fe-2S iron-sulfur cluster-binding protein [Chitinophagales bacterium]
MYHIKVNFEQPGLEPVNITSEPDFSILEAVLVNNIHLNHNCGGVCACTTCHIYVNKGDEHIEEMTDREEDYVDRATNPRLESRLACQCLLLNGSGEIEITIPNQSDIIGHEH